MNQKRIIRTITSLLVILIGLSTSAGGGGVRWKTIRVDAGTTFRQVTNSSLKLYGGVPSVAYGSDHLYYSTLVEDAFVTTIVDSAWGVGMYASLALDPATGHPRISYYDGTNEALKYAEMNADGLSHSWTITTVDLNHADPGGNKTAIALDSANLPHIAYTKLDGHVWHAWLSCTGVCTWIKKEVDSSISASGTNIALVIDSNDFIHIVYGDTSQVLHYAVSDGTWYYEQFTGPGGASVYGEEPSLALTSGTWPAIAYINGDAVNYAWKTGPYPDNWSISTVYYEASTPYSPSSPSLQLPNDDPTQPWISFVDGHSFVRLAVIDDMDPTCPGTDGDFNCDSIDHTSFFRDLSSLAVDTSSPYNLGRVITIDRTTGELRFIQESSPGYWTHMPVDFSSNTGLYSSLAVDSTGPHIGYYDRDATIFKYAELDDTGHGYCGEYGSDWFRCDNAADGTKIGSNVTTGIGYNNYPHLAYYDRAYPALHYATLNPTWSSILIEGDYETNDIGRYASLAFSPATGYARIAYMDVSNGYLKYAQELPSPYTDGNCGPGNTWRCDNVEYISAQGFGISLAITPLSLIHI
jgi:hypothetical protein